MSIASGLITDILSVDMENLSTSLFIKNPGLRSLPLGVERYLVRGGGLSVITLDPDDKIEITAVSYTHLRAHET